MRIVGVGLFPRRRQEIIDAAKTSEPGSDERETAIQLAQAMKVLLDLDAEPSDDSQTIRRVLRATHHVIWRVRPSSRRSQVQVRLLIWFGRDAVHVLVVGNKAELQDLWYVSATEQAERMVDQLIRRETETGRREEGDD